MAMQVAARRPEARRPRLLAALAALAASAAAEPAKPRLSSLTAAVSVQAPKELQGTFLGYFGTFSAPPPADGKYTVFGPPADQLEGCTDYVIPLQLAAIAADTVAVVRRGTCTFVQKTQIAEKAGAKGVIIVSDTDSPQIMSGSNSTTEEDEVTIFAVSVAKSLGDSLLGWAGVPPTISISVYQPSVMDISEAVIICMATSLVVAGAFFATADLRHGSPIAPRREEVVEVSSELAVGFCALGSGMLLVLYFFMQYLIYFLIFAFCFGGGSCIVQFLSSFLQYSAPNLKQRACQLPFFGPVTQAELIAMVPAGLVVSGWLALRNTEYGWFFQDIIGAGFICMVQRTLRLPNIKIATLLLTAMFFFDIFWVFISPLLFKQSVMVAVATGGGTGEAVPMLLRVPAIGDPFGHDHLLGFGDIVLPGLLISYLRRHDVLSKRSPGSGYFVPSVIGYFCGLCVTVVALMIMRMGQPALLYLVPGTLGTTLILAWYRGEFWALWEGTPDHTLARPDEYALGPQVEAQNP